MYIYEEWQKAFKDVDKLVGEEVSRVWRFLVATASSKRSLRTSLRARPDGCLPPNMTPGRALERRFVTFWDFLAANDPEQVQSHVSAAAQSLILGLMPHKGAYRYYKQLIRQASRDDVASLKLCGNSIVSTKLSFLAAHGICQDNPQFVINLWGQKIPYVNCIVSYDKSRLFVMLNIFLPLCDSQFVAKLVQLDYKVNYDLPSVVDDSLKIVFEVPCDKDFVEEHLAVGEKDESTAVRIQVPFWWETKLSFYPAVFQALKAGPLPDIELVEPYPWEAKLS